MNRIATGDVMLDAIETINVSVETDDRARRRRAAGSV